MLRHFVSVALIFAGILTTRAQVNPETTTASLQTNGGPLSPTTPLQDEHNQTTPSAPAVAVPIVTTVAQHTGDDSVGDGSASMQPEPSKELPTTLGERTTAEQPTSEITNDEKDAAPHTAEGAGKDLGSTDGNRRGTTATDKLTTDSSNTRSMTSAPRTVSIGQSSTAGPKDVNTAQARTTFGGGRSTDEITSSPKATTVSTVIPKGTPASASVPADATAERTTRLTDHPALHGIDLYHPLIIDKCSACDIELCRRRCSHGLISRCTVDGEERECMCTRVRLQARSARFVPAKARRVRRCTDKDGSKFG